MRLKLPATLILLACSLYLKAQSPAAENVVLVTIDGLRWQEVFHGLDPVLVEDERYTQRRDTLLDTFSGTDDNHSAVKIFPFLHEVMFQEGAVIGNRDEGSCARVNNPWYFSYPGYNEILTGKPDPAIDSNAAIPNANTTFLEWLQANRPDFDGRIAAFASWDVFPAILNTGRSGLPVNVGPKSEPVTPFEETLNMLHGDIPSPWPTVRLDAFTHHYAMSALQNDQPRVLYVAYGETDDFAHDGHYDQYILAAHRTDRHLRELWEFIQTNEFYRNKTVLMVTVDHGRGDIPVETWQHHASKASIEGYMEALAQYPDGIVGSEAVWIAALGPGVAARGVISADNGRCAGADQIAATLLQLLGVDPDDYDPEAAPALTEMLEP